MPHTSSPFCHISYPINSPKVLLVYCIPPALVAGEQKTTVQIPFLDTSGLLVLAYVCLEKVSSFEQNKFRGSIVAPAPTNV